MMLQVCWKRDIFACPSACEGWGMSLTEVKGMGLPAVSFKNCSAVTELIVDGETGLPTNEGGRFLSKA